jgi:hypothetical protein
MIGYNHLGRNGRLGNQMFQYAALRGIAANCGYDWCIPPSKFKDPEKDHQLFDAFKLQYAKNVELFGATYLEEKQFTFDQELFDTCPDNVNLYGFYQSEKYFKNIESEIRQDFVFVDDILNPCKEMMSEFTETKLISLHVRRTDYVQKQSYHPLCPLGYYEVALTKLPQDIPVLVFSDDPEWCMNQELFSSDRFMISESKNNLVDMCLMAMCNYHIIANSSFSWWGAWLANSEQVIAPKVWFGPDANLDDSDLVPEKWERI